MLKNKKDVIRLIQNDKKMMEIIHTASKLGLPDWWICAGFVRSKIWDTLHGFENRTEIPDVDVIYFDPSNIDEDYEKELEKKLACLLPGIPWSVKNQARMHFVNQIPPYTSSEDAISKFPETATALGVKLGKDNNLILTAPCGINDVIHLEVKPTPFYNETEDRAAVYEGRLAKKKWESVWPLIKVRHILKK